MKKEEYKHLFDLCLRHTDNLLVVLDKNYHVEQISTTASQILGWDVADVRHKFIVDVFRVNLTEPFFKVEDPNNTKAIETIIFEEERDLKITWHSYLAGDYTLLLGKVTSEQHTLPRASSAEEFDLDELIIYPVLDVDKALRSFNQDRTLVHGVFKSMVEQELPADLKVIADARMQNDWDTVSALIHKMKGGAMYCGTTKLQHACLYFEKCKNSGDTQQMNWMLEQLLMVCDETQLKIKDWLADKKEFFK